MNLEGKFLGYKKTILALSALLIVVDGVMFYVGAKYEKSKLISSKAIKAAGVASGKEKKQGVTAKTSKGGMTSSGASQNQNQSTVNPDLTIPDASGDASVSDLQN